MAFLKVKTFNDVEIIINTDQIIRIEKTPNSIIVLFESCKEYFKLNSDSAQKIYKAIGVSFEN